MNNQTAYITGAVRFRGKELLLHLGEAGSIEAREQLLKSEKAASKYTRVKIAEL